METKKYTNCQMCGGYGYTLKHNPATPHSSNEEIEDKERYTAFCLMIGCPIRVRCYGCEAWLVGKLRE